MKPTSLAQDTAVNLGLEPRAPEQQAARQTTVIQATRGFRSLHLLDLWRYRELLYFMVWRDLKVRYKQTLFGASWAIIQPLALMIVFAIFFGRFVKISFGQTPYPVAAYTGLIPWTLFAASVAGSATSIVQGQRIITKVYFPRLVIPVAAVFSFVLDFVIAFALLIGMMVYYHVYPTLNVVYLPLLALLAVLASLSVGIWLSALNVRYRDVNYAVPFLIQIWMFATPIAYPITYVPADLRVIYGLNPMVGVVDGFRWALLGTNTHPGWTIVASTGVVALLLLTGLLYFKRTERTFADVI